MKGMEDNEQACPIVRVLGVIVTSDRRLGIRDHASRFAAISQQTAALSYKNTSSIIIQYLINNHIKQDESSKISLYLFTSIIYTLCHYLRFIKKKEKLLSYQV